MTQKINDLRDRMIVALDVPTIWDAYRIVSQLGDAASFYKIGYALPKARRSSSTSSSTTSATP